MSIWIELHDFDHLSYNGRAVCFNCGSTKRDHETRVFRPQQVDDVSGFPDICESCIREAAAELDLVTGEDLRIENKKLRDLLYAQADEITRLKAIAKENFVDLFAAMREDEEYGFEEEE